MCMECGFFFEGDPHATLSNIGSARRAWYLPQPAALAGGAAAQQNSRIVDAQPLDPITPAVLEPINVSSVLLRSIEQTLKAQGVNALRLARQFRPLATISFWVRSSRQVEFLSIDLLQLSAARFNIAIRENTTSSADWGRMTFLSNGQIAWADADSPSGVVLSGSSLVPGTPMNVLIAIDLDARLVDVYLDGNLRLAAEPTYAGVEGVGAVLLGIDSPTTGPSMLDNLLVTHFPPIQIYSNGFESP